MSFEGHLCWDPTDVDKLLNVEVEQFSDELFLATHTPLKPRRMRYYPPKGERGMGSLEAAETMSEEDILAEFLHPESFAFMPVLGQAGTGKTHLIRWIGTRVHSNENRRVVRIPRVGISLRGVLERIIEGIDGPKFDEVRQQLRRARETMTHGAAREMLLATLGVAVGPNGPPATRATTPMDKLVEKGLPNLFSDTFFKEYLLKDGGYIDRVAQHVVTGTEVVERRERPMAFSTEDLPLSLANVQHNAGKAGRDFYQQLTALPLVQNAAVAWINLHLPEAIRMVLNLGGADLRTLMKEARQELARKNIELVLLIEDFARMQGIEMELLDALTVQPKQSDEAPLCRMRTALACNQGYYETIPDTAKQRATLHVTMDDSGSTSGGINPRDVERFITRYLNAVRLGPKKLREWRESTSASNTAAPLHIACTKCSFRDECHKAFGDHDGIGLYPLNAVAIARVRERISKDVFVPREMLKQGLRPFLETYADDLPKGAFPSAGLIRAMKGPSLKAETMVELERKGGANGIRYVGVVDLWSKAEAPPDVDPGVFRAFKLPVLSTRVAPPSPPPPPKPGLTDPLPPPPPPTPPPAQPEFSELKALDEWGAKTSKLTQSLANRLRAEVFRAIVAEIDWSGELLQEREFAHETNGLFRRTSIVFEDALVSDPSASGVLLQLPFENERLSTAVVLQKLLLRDKAGDWSFPGGDQAYRTVAAHVRRWAAKVLSQVRRIPTKEGPWDAVPLAVELLTLGQLLMGRAPVDDSDGAIMEFVLRPIAGDLPHSRSQEWRNAAVPFDQHGKAIRDFVLASTGCVKGDGSVFMLDAARLLPHARRALAAGVCSQDSPGQLPTALSPISSVRAKLSRSLPEAVTREKELWASWSTRVGDLLGPEHDLVGFKECLLAALDGAQNAGHVGGGVSPAELRTQIKNFDTKRFATLLTQTRQIQSEADTGRILVAMARADPATRDEMAGVLTILERFLSQTSDKLRRQLEASVTEAGLKDAVSVVSDQLAELEKLATKSLETPS
jgi:hypothetical protein